MEVPSFYPAILQIPPKVNYSLVWVWAQASVPRAAETFPTEAVNFLSVDVVLLSLSGFFPGSTGAETVQERPDQQKEGACGRGMSWRKRLSRAILRRAGKRGKGN